MVETPDLSPLLEECVFLSGWSEQSTLTLLLQPVDPLARAGTDYNGAALSRESDSNVDEVELNAGEGNWQGSVGSNVQPSGGGGSRTGSYRGRRAFTAPGVSAMQASRGPLIMVGSCVLVLPQILQQLRTR